jgi:hypothetical protein
MDEAVFVINLTHRTDRRAEMEKELASVGWGAEFFPAIRPSDAGAFPSVGARGCFLSHLSILKQASQTGLQRLTILEDDLSFVDDFPRSWSTALGSLRGADWSIFYPGHLLSDLPPGLSRLDPTLGVRCTHFMVINGNAISPIITGLEAILARPAGHPNGGPMHVDGAYSTIRRQNDDLPTFAYSPQLGYQRPSRSDVANTRWFDRIDALKPAVSLYRANKMAMLKRFSKHQK